MSDKCNVVHEYAQTNIQLYNQLRYLGYSKTEVERVRKAYELATHLFSGNFRPNGKVFISHLVGTASILAEQKASLTVVIAGLLHAVYHHGRFFDPRRSITDGKRYKVRSVVGEEAEDLIVRYTELQWNNKSVLALLQHVDTLDTTQRDVVIIRLANELEDHLDLGRCYGCKKKKLLYDLANSMGMLGLADEIMSVFQKAEKVGVLSVSLRSDKKCYILGAPLYWRLCRKFLDGIRYIILFQKRVIHKLMRIFSKLQK